MNSDQEEVDRATLWMKARANKEGKIIDAKAAELANRIVSLHAKFLYLVHGTLQFITATSLLVSKFFLTIF